MFKASTAAKTGTYKIFIIALKCNAPLNSRVLLLLAMFAEMRGASAHHDALHRRAAHLAWLSGARIDAVLQLKKAAYAVRIHIVRNGRAAQLNRVV